MFYLKGIFNHLANDSLYRNSIYLMLSTAVMAFFGFFFWIISARLYSPDQIGIATTLISVMSLISSFSLLGFGGSLIKYLPSSNRKNEKISTTIIVAGFASIVASLIFIVFLNLFSPKLLFIRESFSFSLMFIAIITIYSLNSLSESVFIAYRSAKYVLIKNLLFSLAKLVFPFLLIAFGAYGIFMSVGLALTIAFAYSVILLVYKFNYLFIPKINKDIIRKITRFSLGTYSAGLIGGLPTMVLPLIIINSIGPKFAAYFYMDMMIANMLYVIPTAVAQSLFAEGSHASEEVISHLKKSIKIISLILIPAIIVTIIFGKYILLAFGTEYSSEGIIFLQLLALSAIFVAVNSIGSALLLINHKTKMLVVINLITTVIILTISLLLARHNLLGIGIAWIVGQAVTTIIYIFIIRNFKK